MSTTAAKNPQVGDLKVWWIPQIGMMMRPGKMTQSDTLKTSPLIGQWRKLPAISGPIPNTNHIQYSEDRQPVTAD